DARVDDGAELVLPSHEVSGFPKTTLRRTADVLVARVAPERDSLAARARTRGYLDHAIEALVGDSLPDRAVDRRAARDVGLVRRVAELSHGNGVPGRRIHE